MSVRRSLHRLREASTMLEDEATVVRLAAEALCTACPGGLALAYTIRGHPARYVGAVAALTEGGGVPLDLERFRRVYRSASLYYDRWSVDPAQRGRWKDLPDDWFRGSEFYPLFQPYASMGRTLVCLGPRPLACAGVLLPARGSALRQDERERLLATAGQTIGPLRVASLLAQAEAALDGVEALLASRSEAAFLLTSGGQVLASSLAGRRALDRRPGLSEVLAGSVRAARSQTLTLVSPEDGCEVHVTPCSPRGAAAGYLVILAALRSPGRVRLTPREAELLESLELGLSNAALASRMGLAPSTVKTMLERLYRKAGVSGRVALLRWARGQGATGSAGVEDGVTH